MLLALPLVLQLVVKSPDFQPKGPIPEQYTCDGADRSPRVTVENLPTFAQSWALVVDDPDAPGSTPGHAFVHWVMWNLKPSLRGIGPNVPTNAPRLPGGTQQGKNSFGKVGWSGPCPPPGPSHHYRFRVFALDGKLALPPMAGAGDLERSIKGHIVGQGELVGTYQRK